MWTKANMVLLMFAIVFSGLEVHALQYDYTATIECLSTPQKSQYGGGTIMNPELDHGLQGWSAFGNTKLEHRSESDGNSFVVVHSRNQSHDSVSQKLYVQENKIYTFSAWIQVSNGSVPVEAMFKTTTGSKYAGAVVAKSTCWSMLKGGLTFDASGPAQLFFRCNDTSVEIRVDSISLQPFTKEQWRSHQDECIEKERKRKVSIQAVDKQGRPLANAKITIELNRLHFPFGSAINKNILSNTAYQKWFTSRFTVTTFENEMKWYSTESVQGKENYADADAMVQFCKQHNIAVRGHNVLWDDPKYQPYWVSSLPGDQLDRAISHRIVSVMSRYKDRTIGWDVVNENMHFNFLESKFGENASARIYKVAHKIDPRAILFLNEYGTLEYSEDAKANPQKYLEKIKEIRSYPQNKDFPLGIGLESHFGVPNLAYVRASLDTLGATGLPIWLTEVDVNNDSHQAEYLEQILREAYSHPKVQGIVLWTAWSPQGCLRICLTDNNFKNLPTGDVVDKLLNQWRSERSVGTTGSNGFFEASLFHGNYEIKVTHPTMGNHTLAQTLQVTSTNESNPLKLHLQTSA